jgi:hypothetical protein
MNKYNEKHLKNLLYIFNNHRKYMSENVIHRFCKLTLQIIMKVKKRPYAMERYACQLENL